MSGSYRVACENCGDSIPAAARFCSWCGTEQQRAVEAIERMRTDGGVNGDVSGSGDARLPRVGQQYETTATIRETLETVDDVNDATRRFNSILNEIREGSADPTVQVAIVEVDNAE